MLGSVKATLVYSPIALLSSFAIELDYVIVGLIIGTLVLPVYIMAAVGGIAKKMSPHIFLQIPTLKENLKYTRPAIVNLAIACFILYFVQIVLLATTYSAEKIKNTIEGNLLIVAIAAAIIAHAIYVVKGTSLKDTRTSNVE